MTAPLHGLGHNRGPAMDDGVSWRRHCWREAREALLPHLPIEVVRMRVRRARELGLDYRTYATARETTGRDIIAFLFSSNALRVLRPQDPVPPARAERLRAITGAARALAAQPPADAAALAARLAAEQGIHFAASGRAPRFSAPWATIRADVLAAIGDLPPGGVWLVAETSEERLWCEAARLGGHLSGDRFFSLPAR
ncbi:MAG: hypothetical protein QM699_15405 [Amaricoccus sp.]|uniref:hypothetical protein n=1 Tax=Amaricoccus sp. TaxID=1872485 RepID=UPI0039E5E32C